MALVAEGARARLLAVHRRRLRHEDLEDCFSQATLELLDQARRGTLRFSSRAHLRNILEQRFVSRISDRRRALGGRSPREATLDGALSLSGGARELEVTDARADVERRALMRAELAALAQAAQRLTPDQRLVLATQVGLQMRREAFCRRYGWSHEKYRKVAQRARARLREALAEAGAVESEQRLGSAPERPRRRARSEQASEPAYVPISPNS